MAKQKRRRPSIRKRFRRWRKTPRIPIETLLAGATIPFTPAQTGWQRNWALSGNLQEIINQLKSGFLGMDIATDKIDIMRALNPLDFERARFTKILIFTTLMGTIRARLTGRYTQPLFKKIPIIGRMIK